MTRESVCLIFSSSVSIHTPTKGVTHELNALALLYLCFNPHTHEGCDPDNTRNGGKDRVSIHTPTKGVTLDAAQTRSVSVVSIHTPTKGVTYDRIYHDNPQQVSIHTPTKGVTGAKTKATNASNVSIHTPTKGVTPNDIHHYYLKQFQSTHPRRV